MILKALDLSDFDREYIREYDREYIREYGREYIRVSPKLHNFCVVCDMLLVLMQSGE